MQTSQGASAWNCSRSSCTQALSVSLIAALHVGDDALERLFGFVAAHAVVIDEFDLLLARTVQDHVPRLFGQVLPGSFMENL